MWKDLHLTVAVRVPARRSEVILFLGRHGGEVSAATSIEGNVSKDYGLFCGQECRLSVAGISGLCRGGPQRLSLLASSSSPFLPLRRNSN